MARQILIEHYDNQLGQLEASYDVEVGKFKDAIKADIKDVNEKLKKLEAEEYVSDYAKGGLVKKSDFTMLGAGLLLGGLFGFIKR
jgi:hypothetical protein